MNKPELPKPFVETLKNEFPEQAEELLESLTKKGPVSIRLNPFKSAPILPLQNKIPWTKNAYYLDDRPAFYADPDFHTGAYYVQEASSMIIEYILDNLNVGSKNLVALDLCAAPGGKSTILSSFLEDKGFLISNELVWKRNLILQENLERWGQSNTIITHSKSEDFQSLKSVFDIALVDAPCSGEGMFRKDPKVISEWSASNVEACSIRQMHILEDIADSVKENGYLIYSTCTYNKKENEYLLDEFLENYPFECLDVDGIEQFGLLKSEGEKSICYRLFPHNLWGEGLSVSLLRKTGHTNRQKPNSKAQFKQNIKNANVESLSSFIDDTENLKHIQRDDEIFILKNADEVILSWLPHLKVIKYGTSVGKEIRGEFIPSHGLAISNLLNKDLPYLELDQQEALRVLQKDGSFLNPGGMDAKWILLKHNGNTICFGKHVNNRINIQLPSNFRIRKNIDEFL